jgi:cellulose synthase/poly-beta-1,6-N-acetylglucosamine synthase-like glycosyltransferase
VDLEGVTVSAVLLTLLVVLSLLMTAQAGYTVYLMLYTWDHDQDYEAAGAPRAFRVPQTSFTALLPAHHEEEVIGETLERVMHANYPHRLLEAIVISAKDDAGTIAAAQAAIDRLAAQGITGARVLVFDDTQLNKPHRLNVALPQARGDVITIFDAEDEIHPDLFNVVNTVMLNEEVRVVQSGVQLMNYDSRWFSALNVLEYYFWFKSRLHAHAKNGMTPLGGNTIFFNADLIRQIGGWDETNLTEDADIGIRLSAMGERVRVVYDDIYVTKEETPPTVKGFIKQRTRWNQGFLQTLGKSSWRTVPKLSNKLMALYILSFPFLQALLALYVPVSLAMVVLVKLPVLATLFLFLPGYALFAHYLLSVIGLHEFARAHGLRLPSRATLRLGGWVLSLSLPAYPALHLLVTYFPYQWALGFAAIRAVWRELRGQTNWEKTAHVGAHRQHTQDMATGHDEGVHQTEMGRAQLR